MRLSEMAPARYRHRRGRIWHGTGLTDLRSAPGSSWRPFTRTNSGRPSDLGGAPAPSQAPLKAFQFRVPNTSPV